MSGNDMIKTGPMWLLYSSNEQVCFTVKLSCHRLCMSVSIHRSELECQATPKIFSCLHIVCSALCLGAP